MLGREVPTGQTSRLLAEARDLAAVGELVRTAARRLAHAQGATWSEPRAVTEAAVALERLAEETATAIDRVGLDDAPWTPTVGNRQPRPA